MTKAKIGRNGPWPCGSGKKYKNCCLVLGDHGPTAPKPFDRYNILMTSLKMKIEQNYAAQIRRIRKPMQDRFLRLTCDQTLPREQESVFSDWLWFDMTDSAGMTFGREYRGDHGDYLEEPLRECLDALNDSCLSVYALASSQGETLHLQDLFTGASREILLKEPLVPDPDQEAPPLLLGRLVSMPEGGIFSGMVLMVGDDKGQGDFIRFHMDYWQRIRPDASIAELCKQHGEVLFGLFDHASHKTTLALNDIRFLPTGQEANELAAVIGSAEDFIPVHNTAGTAWYDLKDSRGPARVGVSDQGHLVFYADAVEDLAKAGELLRFKEYVWQVVNSLLLFTPPPQELGDIWYEVIKERETERWLHTPHHELDGKSPLQLLAEAGGKERLGEMLEAFAESAAGNQYSLDLVNYMRARVN